MALHTQRKPGQRREACTGRTRHRRTGLSRSVLQKKTMLDMHHNSLESSLDLVWPCRAVSTRGTLLRTLTYSKSHRTPQSRQFPAVVHAWRAEDGIARYRSHRDMWNAGHSSWQATRGCAQRCGYQSDAFEDATARRG
jgi:hypothetical protein